ncbi:MAG: sucrose synthase, partial [Acaryochloridaceae cyanobacterium CSU_5_19]|nr:sucrose synthase [Acaryochloridaceae cyanobacterium CSU_5_19]
MSQLIQAVLNSDEKSDLRQFASEIQNQEQRYLLRNDILTAFDNFCGKYEKPLACQISSSLQKLIYFTQEIIVEDENLYWIIRPKIASEEAYRLDARELVYEKIETPELLDLRDRFVGHYRPQEGDILEIDFGPFYDYTPVIRDPKNIGKGVQFLNRFLSSKIFQDPDRLLEVLYNF